MIKIISLGGSIVAPSNPDIDLIKSFKDTASQYLEYKKDDKLILIIGGGGPAREYQKAYREISKNPDNNEQDWIGIAATKLNARLVKAVFSELCSDDVVENPTKVKSFKGRILVASGWKPGFSTDFDAVILAEKFKAKTVINLSNIEKIYSDDPKKNPKAVPLDHISWNDFKKMVGDEWTPGKNLPFDPIASKKASKLGLKIIFASGRNIPNLKNILEDKEFSGSVIGPD